MERRPRRERITSEINIIPLTDVILVLLVIFMIATPLLLQTDIQVKLPETAAAPSMEKSSEVAITITSEAMTYLNKELVTRKELKEKLSVLHQKNPQLSVMLRIDQMVRFRDIVEVLDILTALGVRNLDIAATPRQGS